MEQRVEKKRKIAESMWVHNVITVRTGKVAGQCAMPNTPRWPVRNVLAIHALSRCAYLPASDSVIYSDIARVISLRIIIMACHILLWQAVL